MVRPLAPRSLCTNFFPGSPREQERALSQLRFRVGLAQIVLALLLAVTITVLNVPGQQGSARSWVDVAGPAPLRATYILHPTCLYGGDFGEDPNDDPTLHFASFRNRACDSAAVVFGSLMVRVLPSLPSRAYQATGPPIF